MGLGFLRTASGIGVAICGLTLALRPIQRHAGRWMFGGVAAFGLATEFVAWAWTRLFPALWRTNRFPETE